MIETEDDDALYASMEDTPPEAQIRKLLVRKYATTSAFIGQPASEYPHLAADVAMQIFAPVLARVKAEAEATARVAKAAAGAAAEKTLTKRLAVVEAAARASERQACVQFLHAEARELAAVALEAKGPDTPVTARDVVSLTVAAQRLASQPASP